MSSPPAASQTQTFVRRYDTLTNDDVALVGGKNASLGEMIGYLKDERIRVPDGFARTAAAYWHYLFDERTRSVTPDSVADVIQHVAEAEQRLGA